jgi:hypothetical protein
MSFCCDAKIKTQNFSNCPIVNGKVVGLVNNVAENKNPQINPDL